MLIAVHIVVDHIFRGEFVEQLLCTANLCLLDGTQVQRFHRAFCFGNEEDMLDRSLVECNSPVRRVVSYRRRDRESLRHLGINADLICQIHILRKAAFHAFLCATVSKNIILHVLLGTNNQSR